MWDLQKAAVEIVLGTAVDELNLQDFVISGLRSEVADGFYAQSHLVWENSVLAEKLNRITIQNLLVRRCTLWYLCVFCAGAQIISPKNLIAQSQLS